MNPFDGAVDDFLSSSSATAGFADASPERAAKALRLSGESGIPAGQIDTDIEGYGAQIEAANRAALVRADPKLQAYVASDPLAAKVSSDDLPTLKLAGELLDSSRALRFEGPKFEPLGRGYEPIDETNNEILARLQANMYSLIPQVSQREGIRAERRFGGPEPTLIERLFDVRFLFENNKLLSGIGQGLVEGFEEGFGDEPLGPGPDVTKQLQDLGLYRKPDGTGQPLAFANEIVVSKFLESLDVAFRLFSGATSALGGAAGEGAKALGEEEGMAERLARDVKTLGDISLIIGGTVPLVRKLPVRQKVLDFLRKAEETPFRRQRNIRPEVFDIRRQIDEFLANGRQAPEVIGRDAIVNLAGVDAVVRSLAESGTKKRAPSLLEKFVSQSTGSETVSVSAERLSQLYAEKGVAPRPGDEIFGFVSDIDKQLTAALARGGDIEVDFSRYAAFVKDDVHEALLEDLRVEGATVREAKELAKEAEPSRISYEPVVRFEGKVYRGGSHIDAMDRAAKTTKSSIEKIAEGAEDGFVTSGGEFITRADAYARLAAEETGMAPALNTEAIQSGAEPPVPEGHVRFYHGGAEPTSGGSRFVTTDPIYARDFRSGDTPNEVHYVDVPKGDPSEIAARQWDEIDERAGTNMVGRYHHIELPEEWAVKMQPVKGGVEAEIGSAAREGVEDAKGGLKAGEEALPEEVARKELFLESLFKVEETKSGFTAKSAGMTAPEFTRYSKNLQEFREAAEARRRSEAERRQRKERSSREAAFVSALRREADAEFMERPDIRAEDMLRKAGVKLNQGEVDAITQDKLPRGLRAVDGLSPDIAADLVGYRSGESLVKDLAGLERDRGELSPKEYREAYVRRLAEARAEPLEAALAVEDLVLSEPITRLLYDDLRVMRRQNEGEVAEPLGLEELRLKAAETFGDEPLKRASKLKEYLRDVQRAGRAAELALLKGDVPKAFKAKNQQVMAHFAAREAARFEKDAKRGGKQIARYGGNRIPKSIAPDYVAQIQRVLVQHSIPIKRELDNLARAVTVDGRKKSLETFIAEKEAQGIEIPVAASLFDSEFATPLNDMTVNEYRDMVDSIQAIEHAGREELTIVKDNEKLDRETVVAEVVSNIETLPLRFSKAGAVRRAIRPSLEQTSTVPHGLRHLRYEADATLTKMEDMLDDLDLRDPLGPLNLVVTKPMQAAKHFEDDLRTETAERLGKLPPIERSKDLVPDVPFANPMLYRNGEPWRPFALTRGDMAVAALNLGNKGNKEALVRTLVGPRLENVPTDSPQFRMAERQVDRFFAENMTRADWEFVSGMWRFFASFQKLIDDMYTRLTSLPPDYIQPVAFETPFGPMKGGYNPIMHDPFRSDVQILRERTPYEEQYTRATTPKRYTKARTGVFKPLQVEGVHKSLQLRIGEMIHDIAFREPVNNAAKVLYDPKVRQAIAKHYGPEYANQIDPWLKHAANRTNADDRMLKGLNWLMRGARRNIVVSTLAWNFKTIGTPNIGPLLLETGLRPIETTDMMLHWARNWQFAMEHSQELRNRRNNYDRDVGEVLRGQLGVSTNFEKMRNASARFGMYLAVRTDMALAVITFNKEFANNLNKGYNEDEAAYVADKMVRKYFGAQSPIDLPAIMRGNEGYKLLTMFYGYMNTMANRTRDTIQLGRSSVRRLKAGDRAGARRDFADMLANSFMFIAVPTIIGYVYMKDAIDLEEDSWGEVAGKLLLGQIGGLLPLGRDVASSVLQGYPARSVPAVQIALSVFNTVEELAAGAIDPDDLSDKWIKHAIQTVGYATGMGGLGQLGTSSQFLWNVTTGQDEAETPMDWLRGLVYGESK